MRVSIGDGSKPTLSLQDKPNKTPRLLVTSPASAGGGGVDLGFVETTGPNSCGSFLLDGNSLSSAQYNANAAFDFGTGPFTIEWWQYQTDSNSFPRVFARGSYAGGSTLGLSIEGGSVYFWDNSAHGLGTIYNYKNMWMHFAITRSVDNKLRFFLNGSLVSTTDNYTHDFATSSDMLMIGQEGTPSNASSFGGYITNFHVMKGAARYVSAFTPSTSPLKMTNKTVFMLYALNATDVSKDETNTVAGSSNVTWDSSNPFA